MARKQQPAAPAPVADLNRNVLVAIMSPDASILVATKFKAVTPAEAWEAVHPCFQKGAHAGMAAAEANEAAKKSGQPIDAYAPQGAACSETYAALIAAGGLPSFIVPTLPAGFHVIEIDFLNYPRTLALGYSLTTSRDHMNSRLPDAKAHGEDEFRAKLVRLMETVAVKPHPLAPVIEAANVALGKTEPAEMKAANAKVPKPKGKSLAESVAADAKASTPKPTPPAKGKAREIATTPRDGKGRIKAKPKTLADLNAAAKAETKPAAALKVPKAPMGKLASKLNKMFGG